MYKNRGFKSTERKVPTKLDVVGGSSDGFYTLEDVRHAIDEDAFMATGEYNDAYGQWARCSNRFIDGSAGGTVSTDYTGNWDVSVVPLNQSPGVNAVGRIYIVVKITSTPTFYNDVAVGQVIIRQRSTGTVAQSWYFGSHLNNSGWQTSQRFNGNASVPAPSASPAVFQMQSYTTISNTTSGSTGSANVNAWTLRRTTASNFTGVAEGHADISNGTLPDVSTNDLYSQTSSTFYMGNEATNTSAANLVCMRSPAFTLSGVDNDVIITHLCAGYTLHPMNPNDTLWVAFQ